jgi:hypothetical protein
MGLVAVLFIILAFNINGLNTVRSYNYYEGFDLPLTQSNHAKKDEKDKKDKLKKVREIKDKLTAVKSSNKTSSSSDVSGREGFCMSDKEINMLRGKQSNTIPVYDNNRDQSDNVSPTDKSIFSDSYTSF